MKIKLSDDALSVLEGLAIAQNISIEEAIRKAIATEADIYSKRKDGSKILVLHKSGEVTEILFR
jgi:hypothetical protein